MNARGLAGTAFILLWLVLCLVACARPPDELIPLPLIQRPVEPILIPLYEPEAAVKRVFET